MGSGSADLHMQEVLPGEPKCSARPLDGRASEIDKERPALLLAASWRRGWGTTPGNPNCPQEGEPHPAILIVRGIGHHTQQS